MCVYILYREKAREKEKEMVLKFADVTHKDVQIKI